MNTFNVLILSVSVAVFYIVQFDGVNAGSDEEACSHLDFVSDLYTAVARNVNCSENLCFSPFSIHAMLALTSLGANGNTAKEILTALRLPNDEHRLREIFKNIFQNFGKGNNSVLEIASKIYASERIHPLKDFLKITMNDFGTDFENIDFASAGTKDKINKWIEERTHKRITNIISHNIDPNTSLALLNGIYFKGFWQKKLLKIRSKRVFYINDQEKMEVDMIYVKDHFLRKHDKDIGATILHMPYIGDNLCLVLILPFNQNGLPEVEQKLSSIDLASVIDIPNESYRKEVRVTFPKFKIEQKLILDDALKELGLNNVVYTAVAELSHMYSVSGPHFSHFIHKAVINVDEQGNETPSITGLVKNFLRFSHAEQFIADHPFLFLIRNTKTGAVLFMGRYCDPATSS